mmetsp:Transcript_49629/g.130555  ORF Transcript_49629/g.130555 Transcript_49629/m.130555 type:complete len:224 (-) Transcript_49629:3522-4193(-)
MFRNLFSERHFVIHELRNIIVRLSSSDLLLRALFLFRGRLLNLELLLDIMVYNFEILDIAINFLLIDLGRNHWHLQLNFLFLDFDILVCDLGRHLTRHWNTSDIRNIRLEFNMNYLLNRFWNQPILSRHLLHPINQLDIRNSNFNDFLLYLIDLQYVDTGDWVLPYFPIDNGLLNLLEVCNILYPNHFVVCRNLLVHMEQFYSLEENGTILVLDLLNRNLDDF